ncbi:MAG: PAS domain-containing protein [Gemmatimonadetes bacterium]|nr:PAS domain-containing protein [Gemmatimonadota bacterium]
METASQELLERYRTLQAEQQRHQLALEATQDLIYDWDVVTDRSTRSAALRTVFGHEGGDDSASWWMDRIHDEDRDRFGRVMHDGIRSSSTTWTTEYRFRRANGSYAFVLDRALIVRDGEGNPLRIVGSVADITERKVAEEALERSNRELEQFAYVASHDLQEPLRKIQAFGDRLKGRYEEVLDERGHDYLDRMQHAANRMQGLINDLLSFSRVANKPQPFQPVDLARVAAEVVCDLEVRIQGTGGRVEIDDLPALHADPLQMRQLLQNLIGNALKFHRAGEPPVVVLRGTMHKPDAGSRHPRLCELTVTDNGIGFEEKYLDRVFNPFQRLHGRGEFEGTGMGLAICRKIVERHGGGITARSTPGEGSTFVVHLPLGHTQGDTRP